MPVIPTIIGKTIVLRGPRESDIDDRLSGME
mgnify:CR=1 FL=1